MPEVKFELGEGDTLDQSVLKRLLQNPDTHVLSTEQRDAVQKLPADLPAALADKADKTALNAKADSSELTNYAPKTSLNAKADKSYVDDELSRKANASSLGQKADRTDLDALATKTELGAKADRTALDNYATKQDLDNVDVDLSGYATKSELSTKANASSLGSAASASTSEFATAGQGQKADTALQPGDASKYEAMTRAEYDALETKVPGRLYLFTDTKTFAIGDEDATVSKPTVTTSPSISGTAVAGETVTLDEGEYTGQPSLTLRLMRGSTSIASGAMTYTLTAADVGATLSLEVDATNAGGSITATSGPFGPVSPAGTSPEQGMLDALTIESSWVDKIAPAHGIFEIQGLSEEAYQNAGVVWEFFSSDPDDYPLIRHNDVWADRSKALRRFALGPKSARTFETVENVSWTCDIYYKGAHRRITSGDIAIEDPEVVYGDQYTYYISPAGDFPAGASNTFTTWDDAINAAHYDDTPVGARVLINRGEAIDLSTATQARLRAAWFGDGGLTLGAYGSGEDPQLTGAQLWLNKVVKSKLLNIAFRGGWDASTESGSTHDGVFSDPDTVGTKELVHKCSFYGLYICYYPSATDEQVRKIMAFSECDMGNWQDYGCLGGAEKFSVIGSSITQNPDARGGGKGKGTGHNQHGPLRLTAFVMVIWANDLFSCNGWSTVPASDEIIAAGLADDGDIPGHNPCLRTNSAEVGAGPELCVGANLAEGGYGMMTFQPANDLEMAYPNLVWAQSNIMLGTANTGIAFSAARGGTGIQNNLVLFPPVKAEFGSAPRRFVSGNPDQTHSPGNTEKPITVAGNTFTTLADHLSNDNIVDFSEYAGSSTHDNLIHAPNLASPLVGNAPLDTASLGIEPFYKGFHWEDNPERDTSYATPADPLALYRPIAGSPAGGAAAGVLPEFDFFGNARTNDNIGAFSEIVEETDGGGSGGGSTPSGFSLALVDEAFDRDKTEYVFSGKSLSATGRVYIAVTNASGSNTPALDRVEVTTDGGQTLQEATLVSGATAVSSNTKSQAAIYAIDAPGASGDIIVTFADVTMNCFVRWYTVEGDHSVEAVNQYSTTNESGPLNIPLDVNTSDGGAVIAAAGISTFPGNVWDQFIGVSGSTQEDNGNLVSMGGEAVDLSGEAPRSVLLGTGNEDGIASVSGVAIALK